MNTLILSIFILSFTFFFFFELKKASNTRIKEESLINATALLPSIAESAYEWDKKKIDNTLSNFKDHIDKDIQITVLLLSSGKKDFQIFASTTENNQLIESNGQNKLLTGLKEAQTFIEFDDADNYFSDVFETEPNNITIFKPLIFNDEKIGYLVLKQSYNIWDTSITKLYIAILVAVIMGSLVITASLMVFFKKEVLKPLSILAKNMRKFSVGDLNKFDFDSKRHDEIGTINAKFADMVSRLNISETKNKEYMSEIAKALNEQRRLTTLAEQANKAKSNFLSMISHEVRTPLNGILGILELLRQSRLNEKQRDQIDTIKYSGETLLVILNDLLDFSKMEAGKFEIEKIDFNLHHMIKGVISLMQSRADEKNIALSYHINEKIPQYIHSDPTRLRQVLINFISNAIKFTEKGRVDIRIIIFETLENSDKLNLRFAVHDTGIGISQSVQDKLFQPFTQADNSISRKYGGTGLGLAICLKIIELLEGKSGVNSEIGKGSEFWFDIPVGICNNEKIDNYDKKTFEVSNTPKFNKKLSVLIVEDNAVNQKVITGLLELCGHKVSINEDGPTAIETFKNKKSQCFDLVLMDMQMPGMSGIETTLKIRELGIKTPIIAVTANASERDRKDCIRAGMDEFISKPISPSDLYNAIGNTLPDAIDNTPFHKSQEIFKLEQKASYINLEYIINIENTMGKNYALKMLEEIILELQRLFISLNIAIEKKDFDALKRSAHQINGIAGMIGWQKAEDLSKKIQSLCIEKNEESAFNLAEHDLEQCQSNLESLKEHMAKILASRKKTSNSSKIL